ncbi:MAG: protein ImuB [Thermoleophilaceae bacterium]|jgi:protein ImuB|nr:protein ImuB [Thermoleophilaceae bacterium]
MCSVMVVCVFYPRFELLAGLGDRRALLAEPVALAPEAGREQVVGEVSAAAEAFGLVRGMRLGEAMSRCPALRLIPPDPEGVRSLWNRVLDRLEALGAEVESDRAGAAFFESAGLHGLHGGGLAGVLAESGRALGPGARFGAAPSRFAAHAAALQVRPRRGRRAYVVEESDVRDFLAPLPVALLRTRPELQALPEVFERLGIRTLGEVAELPSRAVAERFGHPGLLAHDLAQGRDFPLEPRRPPEPVSERLDLPDAASGQQLERALELLIARVLARRERRGRSLRALAVSARFVAGGTWRTAVTLRHASADPERILLTLAPKLSELPAPADSLALEVEAFGPPAHDQGRLLDEAAAVKRGRLGEAVRQARQAAGADAALKVLEVDPQSRIPERRTVLAPFPDAPAP